MYPDREKALGQRQTERQNLYPRILRHIYFGKVIILLIVGIAVGVSGHTFRQKAEPNGCRYLGHCAEASRRIVGYSPVVEYTVDGKSYTAMLNMASSSMYPGKRITIYYQKNNPRGKCAIWTITVG